MASGTDHRPGGGQSLPCARARVDRRVACDVRKGRGPGLRSGVPFPADVWQPTSPSGPARNSGGRSDRAQGSEGQGPRHLYHRSPGGRPGGCGVREWYDWAADAHVRNDFGGGGSVVHLTALAEALPLAAGGRRRRRRRRAHCREGSARGEASRDDGEIALARARRCRGRANSTYLSRGRHCSTPVRSAVPALYCRHGGSRGRRGFHRELLRCSWDSSQPRGGAPAPGVTRMAAWSGQKGCLEWSEEERRPPGGERVDRMEV